jgi:hypothetical protein
MVLFLGLESLPAHIVGNHAQSIGDRPHARGHAQSDRDAVGNRHATGTGGGTSTARSSCTARLVYASPYALAA